MLLDPIALDKALLLRDKKALFIDVRTPAEFAEASIPGAVNIPFFSNEERAQVGIVYKQSGSIAARRLGMEIVSPRIPDLVYQALSCPRNEELPVVIFCWRGGMRSQVMAVLFNLAGLPTRQLSGGHKGFRRHVIDFLAAAEWGRFFVLRGFTGVGKTRLLLHLAAEGFPVIDLEGMAEHRGSAFGGLGKGPQPSQKMFETLLWDRLRKVPREGYALLEGESRHIGKLTLPEHVYDSLQQGATLWINASLDYRARIILEDYPTLGHMKGAFTAPIKTLERRLGKKTVTDLLYLLEQDRWEELARELMTVYYDPLYSHSRPEKTIEIEIEPEKAGLLRLKNAIVKLADS